jgi:hypothetical protein
MSLLEKERSVCSLKLLAYEALSYQCVDFFFFYFTQKASKFSTVSLKFDRDGFQLA